MWYKYCAGGGGLKDDGASIFRRIPSTGRHRWTAGRLNFGPGHLFVDACYPIRFIDFIDSLFIQPLCRRVFSQSAC